MYNQQKLKALLNKVSKLEEHIQEAEKRNKLLLKHIHPDHLLSARNLLHYLAIRAHDLRLIQEGLSDLAISSNSHSESYTLNNLQKISYLLHSLAGTGTEKSVSEPLDNKKSAAIIKRNSETLFGKTSFNGQTKIMVTLPTEAGGDYVMVHDLVKAGMNIARINSAHDDKEVWAGMVHNVEKAATDLDRNVKIYMDIAGPKLRTCAIKPTRQEEDQKKNTPYIKLYKGSKLKITRDGVEGHDGALPVVSLSIPEVFDYIKRNESIWFDDGKLGGKIRAKTSKYLLAEITDAPEDGFKLKAEKGINFPQSDVKLPAITDEDLRHLDFVAQHADMVGFSFVQTKEDIYLLQKHLKRLKREDMGIILKIETHIAFRNLPSLLFAVMRSRRCGVMIARGDLAVEIGYSRMAEVQEEILWFAEAAHMPVIWATQVLETMIKKGIATRAEISDVVKSARAECVMLNKGPHIIDAIATVKDIDKRMASHEDKKRKILRSLHVAKTFME